MTLFYDPAKRQPKIWSIIAFICIPILIVVCVVAGTKGKVAQNKNAAEKKNSTDIFQKLDSEKQK